VSTVSKKEVCKWVCERTGRNAAEVESVVQTFMDLIVDRLGRGDRLEFREFGVFELKRRKERTARNPKTGVPIQVPARTVVTFKPGKRMKEHVVNVIPVPVTSKRGRPGQ
jgi:integration host factor subunit beta